MTRASSLPGNQDITRAARRSPSLRCVLRIRSGSLLLEAIIAIGIFSMFLAGIGFTLLLGQRSTIAGGDRARGSFLAEQQLEAVRQMSALNFSSITAGDHGMALAGGAWAFSGTSLKIDGYTTRINVVSKGTDWWEVSAVAGWNFGKTRSGTATLVTELTNWRKVATVGNWANMSRIANVSVSGTPDFQSIAIADSYAYVTSTNASGGKGLYVFDVSNPASPVAVASSFDLGASAYGVAVDDDRLYLATSDVTKEVQVYDISSPSTLSSGNLINTYDMPGSGQARSIAVYGDNVYVGTLNDPPNDEFSALLMSETGPMTLQSSLAMSGSILGIALQDGYAYVANANNAGEFEVVDIFDAENLQFAPGVGIDLTNVQDGTAVATSGTAALIGRAEGSAIDELTLYDIALAPVPSPPPGPWTLEVGGDVNALATIFGSKYAFVAGNASSAQLRVIDLVKFAQGQAPIVKTYNANATMRGLRYNWQNDRLFGITSSTLMVFAPG